MALGLGIAFWLKKDMVGLKKIGEVVRELLEYKLVSAIKKVFSDQNIPKVTEKGVLVTQFCQAILLLNP